MDSGPLKARLWDRYRIRPLIDTRAMWREEKATPGYDPSKPILRPLDPDRVDTILYSEKSEVLCRDPATKEQRSMAFQGFESDRGALKYRCPAAAHGFRCKGPGGPPPRHAIAPEIPHSASASSHMSHAKLDLSATFWKAR